jgi:hypothetical protein
MNYSERAADIEKFRSEDFENRIEFLQKSTLSIINLLETFEQVPKTDLEYCKNKINQQITTIREVEDMIIQTSGALYNLFDLYDIERRSEISQILLITIQTNISYARFIIKTHYNKKYF